MTRRRKYTRWSAPAGTTRGTVTDARTHAKFFEKALTAAGEWARFADPKLIGVLALLGLGLANIVSRAGQLWDAHEQGWVWGWLAAAAFLAAGVFATLTVIFASLGLFPRTKRKHESEPSTFFFAGIASFETPEAYEKAVHAKSEEQLESDIAHQAWEVATVAARKHFWAKHSYRAVIAFLGAWVVARVALSFVS